MTQLHRTFASFNPWPLPLHPPSRVCLDFVLGLMVDLVLGKRHGPGLVMAIVAAITLLMVYPVQECSKDKKASIGNRIRDLITHLSRVYGLRLTAHRGWPAALALPALLSAAWRDEAEAHFILFFLSVKGGAELAARFVPSIPVSAHGCLALRADRAAPVADAFLECEIACCTCLGGKSEGLWLEGWMVKIGADT